VLTNNRLKTPRARADSGLAPELAFNISIETIFLTRTYQAIRVRKTFCYRAGTGLRELGKR